MLLTGKKMIVSIIMGSESDRDKMQAAADALSQFNVSSEIKILSAHRSPDLIRDYVNHAVTKGIKIFICGAGMAAHLAGCVAGLTPFPVIGVPLSGSALNGKDALFSTVQMPKGIPVATVAIDGAFNAGMLAVQMLSISDDSIANQLKAYRQAMADKIAQLNQ